MLRSARMVTGHNATVLIQGETGTGKERLAQCIHDNPQRSGGPFVPADCTNFSEHFFESQLFGHVRGAFTGAMRDSVACARAAHRGTLFLDKLGELPLALQAKLPRLLQERTVMLVGESRPVPADIRLLAATNHAAGGKTKACATECI
jgi:transcriptional regulator with PAS, ATPase and Fis domain